MESITNHETRANLAKRLALSDYRAEVHEEILEEAHAQNAEFNTRALAEKMSALHAAITKATETVKTLGKTGYGIEYKRRQVRLL